MKLVYAVLLTIWSLTTVTAQSQKNYDAFRIDLNKKGSAVALFFRESNGAGCSPISSAIGVISAVDWDIVPTKFSARFKTGTRSFFVPDVLNQVSNVDRGLIVTLFRKGKRVKVTWRDCGSGNVPDLIGINVLPQRD